MNWIETTLNNLEGSLRSLLEGDMGSAGIPHKLHRQLQGGLIQVMRTAAKHNLQGVDHHTQLQVVPDHYVLLLPSSQAEFILKNPAELDRLTRKLEQVAQQEGFTFLASPLINVVADPLATEMKVYAQPAHQKIGDSHTSRLEEFTGEQSHISPQSIPLAYLIVNGLSSFPLTLPVINIGRDPDNHLCLDDLRISRMHAQIRFIQDRFIIFDLDSKGGTFVNGVPVTSQVLKTGDVILLAGLPLVYGQDMPSQADYTQELPADPPAPEVL